MIRIKEFVEGREGSGRSEDVTFDRHHLNSSSRFPYRCAGPCETGSRMPSLPAHLRICGPIRDEEA